MKRGKDYIGVGVGAFIFNNEGRIFITKRGRGAQNELGKWQIPGGAVEFNETCEDAAKRETLEETGMEIEVIELLHVSNHIWPDQGHHWVTPSYICRHLKGEPQILETDKCEAIGWFTFEEAEQLDLSRPTRHDLEAIKKKYPNGYTL